MSPAQIGWLIEPVGNDVIGYLVDKRGRRQSLPVAQTTSRPRLPARPICASVPLLNRVTPISARVGRHEDSPFSCEPDRLRRAQGTAG
jgi:hypothetical protein